VAASDAGGGIWDAVTGAAIAKLPHTGQVQFVQFTPDSSRAVVLGQNQQLAVYDAATGALQFSHLFPDKDPISSLVLTPDGRGIVNINRGRDTVEVRDMVSGELRVGPFHHSGLITATALSPDGTHCVVATSEGTAFLWDLGTSRPAAPPLQHGQALHQAAFSLDGRRLVTVADDGSSRAWDVRTGLPISPMLIHAEPITWVGLAPDGSRLAVRGKNGSGIVWDLTPDLRPVDDLLHLTRLLSSQALDGRSGCLEAADQASLREAWGRLGRSAPLGAMHLP
jgi:WD40 repeat protein